MLPKSTDKTFKDRSATRIDSTEQCEARELQDLALVIEMLNDASKEPLDTQKDCIAPTSRDRKRLFVKHL